VINPQALTTQHLAITNNQLYSAYNPGIYLRGATTAPVSFSFSELALPPYVPALWLGYPAEFSSDLVVVNRSNLE